MSEDPSQRLNEAREAFSEKNYPVALEHYQWFFDNAIEIDRAYYGVRLSYCLDEWADLGAVYPPALEVLSNLKNRTLSEFRASQKRQTFHEFSSICEYLNCNQEAYEEFLSVRSANIDFSHKLFSLVYEYCASEKLWDLCREYLGNGYKRYERSIESFDHLIEFSKKREGKQRAAIHDDALEAFKREVLWILDMLSYINAPGEYESAISKVKEDLKAREYEALFSEINNKRSTESYKI